MRLRRIAAQQPLIVALIAEAVLIPLALGLALLVGQTPWMEFHWPPGTALFALAATLPLIVLLLFLSAIGPGWFRELEALVQPAVEMLFRGQGHAAVVLAAALAGLGEELLFRGVLQAWLADLTRPWIGLLLASLVFGLMHAVSRAYFIVATIMGLYLGALYQFTGNLVIVSLVHAFYDWFAIGFVLHRMRAANGRG